ncbi:hypothetical protein LQF76_14120 [Gloeomargaritales cyanobacterium VI4D9]|nr:hypothetical protein LQF76_14120 [Gloeomargaritales cyanobacterium VI4D9]
MKNVILASAVGLGLAVMGTPALANPYHYGQKQVIYPYGSFVQVYPSVPVYGGVYVAPLQAQPVYGTVVPYAVTAYPYVNYNSKTGFSYGFTTFPGGAYPTVGGYTTPVYGPGWVIYPNAPRYGY